MSSKNYPKIIEWHDVAAGFLGIETAAPTDIYLFLTNTKGFAAIKENTIKKGTKNYWHGEKETLSWDNNAVYIKGVKFQLFTTADIVKYAFVRRSDGFLVAFIESDSTKYIGMKVYKLSVLDKDLTTQTAAYSNANYFTGLTSWGYVGISFLGTKWPFQFLVNRTATQLVIIGKNDDTPTSGHPVTVPAAPSAPFNSGLFGYDVVPASLQGIYTNQDTAWNTVFDYSISTMNDGNVAGNTWLTQNSATDQYIRHIYKLKRTFSTVAVNIPEDILSFNVVPDQCSVPPGTYNINVVELSESATGTETTVNIEYIAVYTGTVKDSLYIATNGSIAYNTMGTSVSADPADFVYSNSLSGFHARTYYEPFGGAIKDPQLSYVSGVYNRFENTLFTASLVNADFTQSETYSYQRDCQYNFDSTSTANFTEACGASYTEYTYVNNTTEALSTQACTSSATSKEADIISGMNNYATDSTVTYNNVICTNTPDNYITLATLNAATNWPRDHEDWQNFENASARLTLIDTDHVTVSENDTYNWTTGTTKSSRIVNFIIADTVTHGTGGDTARWLVEFPDEDSYFCFAYSQDSKLAVDNPVILELDRFKNALYAWNITATTPVQSGAKAYKNGFTLDAKNTEINTILEIPDDVKGVV